MSVGIEPEPHSVTTGGFPTLPAPQKPSRRRKLLVRLLLGVLALSLVLGGAAVGGAFYLQNKYDNNIDRFGDPFAGIPAASRPAPAPANVQNILLLGSDSRVSAGDPSAWAVGAQRTDAIMVAHVPADRSGVQIVSIPRDSYVDIPGRGKNKINAAFSFGGPTLMVQTVEQLTKVRIDHVVMVDFTGFTQITDALGGVTINVAKATKDERSSFEAGPQRMNGEQALNYVRQRHNLPGGDFDRVKRHQNWIRAVARETLDRGTLTNPLQLNRVLNATTKTIATDDGFSVGEMRSLALSSRNVRAANMSFLTAPVKGTGRAGSASIVVLDEPAGAELWRAMAADKMKPWLAEHQDSLLPSAVR
jgi:LCP family protein required for cell wall assembly